MKKLEFFVYVIESPNDFDLLNNRTEGNLIKNAVSLDEIPCVVRTATSKETFSWALSDGLIEAIKDLPRRLPILHISAHGNEEGLGLTNGEIVTWNELKDRLIVLNEYFQNELILCMSSCKGLSACRMAMRIEDDQYPFLGMIGNDESPTWSETAIGFATFYHHLRRGSNINNALNAMKVASGNNRFRVITSDQARKAYLDGINEINLLKLAEELKERE